MRYLHRVFIGMTGAIGKMGPQSQLVTNRIGFQIGREIGMELVDRKLLSKGMTVTEVWAILNEALEIDSDAQLEEREESGRPVMTIRIHSCNICPKKVGKYAIPGTACPVGGILKGVAATIGLMDFATYPDLVPGEVCSISVPVKADAP